MKGEIPDPDCSLHFDHRGDDYLDCYCRVRVGYVDRVGHIDEAVRPAIQSYDRECHLLADNMMSFSTNYSRGRCAVVGVHAAAAAASNWDVAVRGIVGQRLGSSQVVVAECLVHSRPEAEEGHTARSQTVGEGNQAGIVAAADHMDDLLHSHHASYHSHLDRDR